MSSVTARIKEVKQPRGGYVKPSQFEIYQIDDKCVLSQDENVSPSTVGTVVDYLTRFAMGTDVFEAFKISYMGAKAAEDLFGVNDAVRKVSNLLSEIKAIDDKAIINACNVVTYDVWYRRPMGALMAFAAGSDVINPDKDTIQNIKIMVQRSVQFWEKYGPIVKDGFTFEPNGYTATVDAGDGDYLTENTLWDFKVSKSNPTSKNTLQLLMYWIMGQHSGQEIYKNIQNLGIFNPRLNIIHLLNVNEIPKDIIAEIEKEIICY